MHFPFWGGRNGFLLLAKRPESPRLSIVPAVFLVATHSASLFVNLPATRARGIPPERGATRLRDPSHHDPDRLPHQMALLQELCITTGIFHLPSRSLVQACFCRTQVKGSTAVLLKHLPPQIAHVVGDPVQPRALYRNETDELPVSECKIVRDPAGYTSKLNSQNTRSLLSRSYSKACSRLPTH